MTSSSPPLFLFETDHWIIEQRPDAALPGYLVMSAKKNTTCLWELNAEALGEMGGHLAHVQKLMMEALKPTYLYIGRYGHMKGCSFHFHFIPIYDWVIEGFLKDERYRVLNEFQYRSDGVFAERQFDASELQLYVWREFCESSTPPQVQGLSVSEAMELLEKFHHQK
jgi:diadenosine tetraphosphate (Ap4A) HIT family hydrolase